MKERKKMTDQIHKPTVAVGMSGGVDSSIAAALLLEQGYHVIGMMMRLWNGNPDHQTAYQQREAQERRVKDVAGKLSIPFEIIDLETEFRTQVVGYYLKTLQQGLTPNPCFVCNQVIKWGALLDAAIERGAQFLATGHYARVGKKTDGTIGLYKGADDKKDQSYVLAGLDQIKLAKIMLPLGERTKDEIRHIAHRLDLGFHKEEESQDLCFLGGVDQDVFINSYAPETNHPGLIRDVYGKVLGEHGGLSKYTIGQRKGLGSGFPEAVYVIGKDVLNNELVIGTKELLGSQCMTLGNINWISGRTIEAPTRFDFKIRYKSSFIPGVLSKDQGDDYQVVFETKVRDATPGQFAVFYRGDEVIGSGVIKQVIREGK